MVTDKGLFGENIIGDLWGSDFEINILEESDNLPDPDVIATKDSSELGVQSSEFREIVTNLSYSKSSKKHDENLYLPGTKNLPWQLPYRPNKMSSCMVTRKMLFVMFSQARLIF